MNAPNLISGVWYFLTFRGLKLSSPKHVDVFLIAGLIFAWIAGIGRYWDHPSAQLWQYLGLGSVIYVFVLALLIWGIIAPLKPINWRYKDVLTFVALTSPLAWLYAIPVERFLPMETAIDLNIYFLAIVAFWRVALFVHFLKAYARLSWLKVVVASLLPLAIILFALTLLNLEQAVFEIMAGLEEERSRDGVQRIHDSVYATTFFLGILSIWSMPILVITYLVMIVKTRNKKE